MSEPLPGPDVLHALRHGDALVNTHGEGWRLVGADRPVSDDDVRWLRRLPQREGRLQSMGDGLPGIGAGQTWVWVL
jgi:hypothetical protein